MYDVAELVEGYGLAESKHTRAVRQAMERLMQGIVRRLLGQMRKMITKSQGTHEETKIFTKRAGQRNHMAWVLSCPVLSSSSHGWAAGHPYPYRQQHQTPLGPGIFSSPRQVGWACMCFQEVTHGHGHTLTIHWMRGRCYPWNPCLRDHPGPHSVNDMRFASGGLIQKEKKSTFDAPCSRRV